MNLSNILYMDRFKNMHSNHLEGFTVKCVYFSSDDTRAVSMNGAQVLTYLPCPQLRYRGLFWRPWQVGAGVFMAERASAVSWEASSIFHASIWFAHWPCHVHSPASRATGVAVVCNRSQQVRPSHGSSVGRIPHSFSEGSNGTHAWASMNKLVGSTGFTCSFIKYQ